MSVTLNNTTQKDWLSGMGITPEIYSGYDDNVKLAIGDSYKNVGLGSISPSGSTGNPTLDYSNAEGMFGLTNGMWNNLGQVAGLAGAGYNIYDGLLGNKSKLFKEQIGSLKDQRAHNNQLIADRKQFKSNIGSGLSGSFANG